MIVIVDYDTGNLRSVEKAFTVLGADLLITRDHKAILTADQVVLPGVGSFGDVMEKLHQYQLVEVLKTVALQGTPLLGICLGMQVLFEGSEESPGIAGLGLLPGTIKKIPSKEGMKIPHMGWNALTVNPASKLMAGIKPQSYVYFVHSYYLYTELEQIVAAVTEYGVPIHAAVEQENIFGCQFHPEKSSETGLKILKNFIRLQDRENFRHHSRFGKEEGCDAD